MRRSLVILLLCAAAPAQAWVPATVGTGCMDRWYTPDVNAPQLSMAVDSAGIGGIPAATVQAALRAALLTWNGVQCPLCNNPGGVDCQPLTCAANPLGVTLQDGGISPHAQWGLPCAEAASDGTFSCKGVKANGNWVIPETSKALWQWSQFAAAQTVLTSNQATGEIIDADILFNLAPRDDGSTFSFCEGDCAAKPSAYPLCIPLTHELGHVLGLNHSLLAQATMAASAVPSDTYKCQLNADDIAGVCTLYRTTCSGQAGAYPKAAATCSALGQADAGPTDSGGLTADASGSTDGTSNRDATPFACQAGRSSGSLWSLLILLVLMPIRRGWGRSQARPT